MSRRDCALRRIVPKICFSLLPALVISLSACITRDVGQIELFEVNEGAQDLGRFLSTSTERVTPGNIGDNPAQAEFGDLIRSSEHVVTIQVHTVHLKDLPWTLTQSRDVLLFTEVWENAVTAQIDPPLTSVLFLSKNQPIPGIMNFQGNLAYGPTRFTGHPLKIRFTIMVLQKDRTKQGATIVDVIGGIVSNAAPQYATIASDVAGIIKAILMAQPDVVVFDFEATLMSDRPEELIATVIDSSRVAKEKYMKSITDDVTKLNLTDDEKKAAKEKVNSMTVPAIPPDWSKISQEEKQATIAEHVKALEKVYVKPADEELDLTKIVSDALVKSETPEVKKSTNDNDTAKGESGGLKDSPSSIRNSNGWNARMPWLKYGFYALVETRHRRSRGDISAALKPLNYSSYRLWFDSAADDLVPATQQDTMAANAIKNPTTTNPANESKKTTTTANTTTTETTNGPFRQPSWEQVQTSYLVFSITPGQLNQNREILVAASQANVELMSSLRRSAEDTASALKDLQSHSESLVKNYLKIRAEEAARKVARNLKRRENRREKFGELFKDITDKIAAAIPEGDDRTAFKAFVEQVKNEWMIRFDGNVKE